jgi:hypothetical protein
MLLCLSATAFAGGFGSTVGGGVGNNANGDYSTVSGGSINSANGIASVVGGGDSNSAAGDQATIGGGVENSANQKATVSGGENNDAGYASVVGGGTDNSASAIYSFIGGGFSNVTNGAGSMVGAGVSNESHGAYSTIGGGEENAATGDFSTIGGGFDNAASGAGSTVGGGSTNVASGNDSTVPGGYNNVAGGDGSFAGGQFAVVRDAAAAGKPAGDAYTFIWSDGSKSPFTSTGSGQFMVSAAGGFGLNAAPINAGVAMTVAATAGNPKYAGILLRSAASTDGILISSGDAVQGANNASLYIDQANGVSQTRRLSLDQFGRLTISNQAYKPGGGSWAASSDGRLKTNVQPMAHALDQMLALKGVTFEYAHPDNGMHPSGTFSGFIAQEVEKVFPSWIGHDNDGYLTVGPQGFEALTVEALRELKTSESEKVAALERDNAELRELVANQAKAVAELRREVASIDSAGDTSGRQVAAVTP